MEEMWEAFKEIGHKGSFKPLPENKEIKGLGGWLIIFQIGLWIELVVYGIILLEAESYSFILFLTLFILSIITLAFMYTKDKRFPFLAILGLWLPLINVFIDFVNTPESDSGLQYLAGAILIYAVPAIIWTLYFRRSKRVKNTFIEKKLFN